MFHGCAHTSTCTSHLRIDTCRRFRAVLTKPTIIADTDMIPITFLVQIVVMYTSINTFSMDTADGITFAVTSRTVKPWVTDTVFPNGSNYR